MEIKLTNDNFKEEVLDSKIPVLVDFWAEWCGPCRMLAPVVEALANEADGKYKVGKVNVDEQEQLCMEYGIMSIPTVIIFKDGKAEHKSVGVQPKSYFKELL
ncbi:MAG: thioredoxin [Clostridia bacterium]|nr:thioredoxin [Clostridia bacterium]